MQELAVIRICPNGFWCTVDGKVGNFNAFETNRPLSKNLNDAVKLVDSKYIVRIDGDDEIRQDFIDYGLFLIKKFGIAISPIYLIQDVWKVVDRPQGAGIFYERKKFIEVGGYDESLDAQADLDFYIRYTRQHSIFTQPTLIYLWKPGRSKEFTPSIQAARSKILEKHKMHNKDVHHFGAYAYIGDKS